MKLLLENCRQYLEEEPEPKTFLSVDSIEKVYINEPDGELKDYPSFEYNFEMGTRKRSFKREAYTFLELLGDFGGFNDGIVLLPAILMTFYNS